jgi:transposase
MYTVRIALDDGVVLTPRSAVTASAATATSVAGFWNGLRGFTQRQIGAVKPTAKGLAAMKAYTEASNPVANCVPYATPWLQELPYLNEIANRAKRGSKHHLICDGRGVPLAVRLTARIGTVLARSPGAGRCDSPLDGERGRPRWRPDCVLGDRGYDAAAIRRGLRARHIEPLVAMRRTKHGSGLGRWRWVVERTFAWLNQFRRLRVRYDKRPDIHEAFLSLGCALICWQSLRKTWGAA